MGIEVEGVYLYVEDVRIVLKALQEGAVFWKKCKRIWLSSDQAARDRTSGETPTARTARILGEVQNTITEDLVFTTETGEDFKGGELHCNTQQIYDLIY